MTEISVQDIEALVRSFDNSDWDELHVVVDGLELHISKNPTDCRSLASTIAPAIVGSATPSVSGAVAPAPTARETLNSSALDIPNGMVVVRAPHLGTFYRAPKPGAPPYVSIDQKVEAETEICLIEVMKLFTSVLAGVRGTVHRIFAEDSQLVEFDQPLFLIDTQS